MNWVIEEALAAGITLIEWPERMERLAAGGTAGRHGSAMAPAATRQRAPAARSRLQGGGDWPERLADLKP